MIYGTHKYTSYKDTPFMKDKNLIYKEHLNSLVIYDKYPVCEGHLLFIPKINNTKSIKEAFEYALKEGETQVQEKNRFKKLLDAAKRDAEYFYQSSHGNIWQEANRHFHSPYFIGGDSYLGNSPGEGLLYQAAGLFVAPDAYEKIVAKIEKAIKNSRKKDKR